MKFINFVKNHFAIIGTILLSLILVCAIVFPSIIISQNSKMLSEPDFIMGETEYGLSVLEVNEPGVKKSKLVVPEGVKYIGRGAFLNSLTSLVEIELPSSLETIEGYAFSGMLNLEKVTFAEKSSLKEIGSHAFNECLRLKTVNLPETSINDVEIKSYAFSACNKLEKINLNCATVIGNYAFSGCGSLEYVNIGNKATTIGDYGFSNCKKIKTLTLPNSIISIGLRAFRYWTSAQTIKIDLQESASANWSSSWKSDCAAQIIWNED